MVCFKSGVRSRDVLVQVLEEKKELGAQNQQLLRRVQQLQDALHAQREESRNEMEQQTRLRHFLEKDISVKNQALLECLRALGTSLHGTKGMLQGVSDESPEKAVPGFIQDFEEVYASFREAKRELDITKGSNQRLIQQEADALDQKKKAESQAKRQVEAAELRSKALEENNQGLQDLVRDLQDRLDQVDKERRNAKERGLAEEGKVQQMQQALDEAHEQADRATKEQQQMRDALNEATQSLEHLKRALASVEQRLHEAESMQEEHAALKARMQQVEMELTVTLAELHDTKERLAALMTKSIAQGVENETLTKRLVDHRARKDQLQVQLAQAKSELRSTEAQLGGMNEKYVAAKQELLASNEKLASMLQEHHSTLEEMNGSGNTLLITTRELQECKKHLEEARRGIDSLRAVRREAQQKLAQAHAELQVLDNRCSSASLDNACKRSLLASIVRLGAMFASRSKDGDAGLDSYYQAAMTETHMQVKLCDLSASLVGPLTAGLKDTKSLEQLVVDMDTSREVVPEKAGLRIAALAAALSLNTSLHGLELRARGWEEQGLGLAAPFLGLGCPAPSASMDAPASTLACVQVDTRLFGPSCARALADLLLKGTIQLKQPSGAGVLRLYTEHCNLDEWYGCCIQHAHLAPLCERQGQPLTQAALQQHTTASNGVCGGKGGGSGSNSHGHREADTPNGVQNGVQLEEDRATAGSSVQTADVAVHLPPPPPTAQAQGQAPMHGDLAQEGLESHHMVMVLAVLLTCPQLKSLRLDGNKVADAGFEILSVGLQHNCSLRELSVCRNMMGQAGARALGRALRANTGLKRLDVSSQRFEGLGPAGIEPLASSLRHNKTLQELGMAGNALGMQGAAMLAAALPSNSTLQRLIVVGSTGMEETARHEALQKAAKRHDLVVS